MSPKNTTVFLRIRPPFTTRSSYPVECVSSNEVAVKERSGKKPRCFNFSRVFGSDSSQKTVFDSVVSPLINDVWNGYNCTILSYGGSRSGKTYTIQGEKSNENFSWDQDPKAGFIPRAIGKLFDLIESQNVEFSVKISLLEIYNEELIDLLSSNKDEESKLKIFDDNVNKGGVIISDLETINVRDKAAALSLFEAGCQKRHSIPVSQCFSSQSHSVFTMTVKRKETCDFGEENMYSGKLIIVDLAGNENVFSADKQVRDSVKINQAMLTLNRVIIALTTHASHIPYRDSKLTRILQDSLGGSSKTVIIGTLSPESTNMEETINSLEYMTKAKHIMICPQANKSVYEKDLLKKYACEVERLRKDLNANRNKEGIYLEDENYQALLDEISLLKSKCQNTIKNIKALRNEKDVIIGGLEKKNNVYKKRCNKIIETLQNVTAVHLEATTTIEKLHSKINTYESIEESNIERNQALKELIKASLGTINSQNKAILDVANQCTREYESLINDTKSRGLQIVPTVSRMLEDLLARMKESLLSETMVKYLEICDNICEWVEQKLVLIGNKSNEMKIITNELGEYTVSFNNLFDFLTCLANKTISIIAEAVKENKVFSSDFEKNNETLKTEFDKLKSELELKNKVALEEHQLQVAFLENAEKKVKDRRARSLNLLKMLDGAIEENTSCYKDQIKNVDNCKKIEDTVTQMKADLKSLSDNQQLLLSKTNETHQDFSTFCKSMTDSLTSQQPVLTKVNVDLVLLKSNVESLSDIVTTLENNIKSEFTYHCSNLRKAAETEAFQKIQDSFGIEVKDLIGKNEDTCNAIHEQFTHNMKEVVSNSNNIGSKVCTLTAANNEQLNNLISADIKMVNPTGLTPKRQEYNYQQNYKETSPHDVLRNRFKSKLN